MTAGVLPRSRGRAGLAAALLGNITAMINSFDKSNAQLRDIMSTLHRLIGKYDVPTKLQKRVFMYVQTQWSTTKGLDTQRLLSKLPPADVRPGARSFSVLSYLARRRVGEDTFDLRKRAQGAGTREVGTLSLIPS